MRFFRPRRPRAGRWCAAWAAILCLAAGPARAQTGEPVHVVTYTIQTGDTMSAIADYFYKDQTRADAIADYNRLANLNRIRVGQELQVPFYDARTWAAYAERTGATMDADAAVAGGSKDVAVTQAPHPGAGRRWWAILVYGAVAVALTAGLYIRSRRHSHEALGLGSARR